MTKIISLLHVICEIYDSRHGPAKLFLAILVLALITVPLTLYLIRYSNLS